MQNCTQSNYPIPTEKDPHKKQDIRMTYEVESEKTNIFFYSLSKIVNQKGLNRIQDVFLIKALACMDGMQYRLFVG